MCSALEYVSTGNDFFGYAWEDYICLLNALPFSWQDDLVGHRVRFAWQDFLKGKKGKLAPIMLTMLGRENVSKLLGCEKVYNV